MIVKIWNNFTEEYEIYNYDTVPQLGTDVLLKDQHYSVMDVLHDLENNCTILEVEGASKIPYGYEF